MASKYPTKFLMGLSGFLLVQTVTLACLALSTDAFSMIRPTSLMSHTRRTCTSPVNRPTALIPQQFNEIRGEMKSLSMAKLDVTPEKSLSSLPFWLDPNTKGGAIFLSLVLFVVPIIGYGIITSLFGVDGIEAGKWIGVGFTVVSTALWVSTYIFRVATKDMTYAKQLKDYENAVIAKRLEELDDDEIQALVEDIERDEF